MTAPKQYAVMNCAAVAGVAASLFIVPGRTPVWLWLAVSVVVIAVLNAAFYLRSRSLSSNARTSRTRTAVIWAGTAVLIADALARWWH